MSFAAIEARASSSIFKLLANAEATYTPGVGDSVVFPVVFDSAGAVIDEFGTVAQMPRFTMQPSAFSSIAEGMALTLRGSPYKVRSVVPLDEGGWQRVTLAQA